MVPSSAWLLSVAALCEFIEMKNLTIWEAEKKKSNERLISMRSYNERVLDRTKTYLTPSQFDQLKRRLDNELRRFELMIELTDIDEAN